MVIDPLDVHNLDIKTFVNAICIVLTWTQQIGNKLQTIAKNGEVKSADAWKLAKKKSSNRIGRNELAEKGISKLTSHLTIPTYVMAAGKFAFPELVCTAI